MYLCKFDTDGKRTATVIDGVHFSTAEEKQKYLDDGYIETSDEDYAYYVGNRGAGANGTGYVRGADGKPTDYIPPEPTETERKTATISAIKAKYNEQLDAMASARVKATMLGADTSKIDANYKNTLAAMATEIKNA